MARDLSNEMDPLGNLAFPAAVNATSLQARFLEYVKNIEKFVDYTPFRSGNDDEPTIELLTMLEDITNDYISYLAQKDATKATVAKQKNHNKLMT